MERESGSHTSGLTSSGALSVFSVDDILIMIICKQKECCLRFPVEPCLCYYGFFSAERKNLRCPSYQQKPKGGGGV